mmetsp:Transcript_50650/g.79200  ORF Transcript_50650/g.79200 Transcript_50650/m.79200 type:complete len:208 (+) Transcript_50650:213-836(+)
MATHWIVQKWQLAHHSHIARHRMAYCQKKCLTILTQRSAARDLLPPKLPVVASVLSHHSQDAIRETHPIALQHTLVDHMASSRGGALFLVCSRRHHPEGECDHGRLPHKIQLVAADLANSSRVSSYLVRFLAQLIPISGPVATLAVVAGAASAAAKLELTLVVALLPLQSLVNNPRPWDEDQQDLPIYHGFQGRVLQEAAIGLQEPF